MSEEEEPTRHSWKMPLAVSIGGTVFGGLLLIVILQVSNVLADLSFVQILVFVVGPVVLLGVLGFAWWVVRRIIAQYTEWWQWRHAVTDAVNGATDAVHAAIYAVRRLHLAEVIQLAESLGWEVTEDADGDLAFVSPDDDYVYVRAVDPDQGGVAEELHNAAPSHFPDTFQRWLDAIAAETIQQQGQIKSLMEAVGELEKRRSVRPG